ncbi:NUDIX domain-containing protein [Sphingomonas naphthae]|uniref:NUDIX domain-containing protein n=1 Tax=Sphingomonas naphthae TaxID=1813468 RepID=A0ABY7TJ00_9SPHN|nr:NUDIX domain-containing protein [Sphingomonas naphthae]WCT72400.1 NUDIX domain-containing protein [Sphingomonas naphthae]
MSDAPNPPIPAATLILMRPQAGRPPAILMVERGATLAFAAGAIVFPGGRVDPEDHVAAGGDEDRAHRIAAVRETAEEVGVTVDPEALTYFARWRPHAPLRRVFDTRFYLAEAPDDAEPVVDGSECATAFWATAAETLAMAEAGEIKLIFPTRRNLERLARFADIEAARADCFAHPPQVITPQIVDGVLRIPEGLGYPVTEEPLEAAMRQ